MLVTLGVSGAWIANLTVLEPYRPLFVSIALIALFLAWRRLRRPGCKSGEAWLALAVTAGPVGTATKSVTLSVPGMNCAACPLTVKKALSGVDGVTRVEVSLDQRRATVTYDDARTDVDTLVRATREAGYPSTPAQEER